jgi:hypothetical protein
MRFLGLFRSVPYPLSKAQRGFHGREAKAIPLRNDTAVHDQGKELRVKSIKTMKTG